MQTNITEPALVMRIEKTSSTDAPSIDYLRGLREGLELTGRHTRLNLLFAFSLGFLVALALAGLFGGGV